MIIAAPVGRGRADSQRWLLPPHPTQQKAQEFGYNQSMMARFCKLLEENVEHNVSGRLPVLQLNVQYRMHPDICLFPSNYVYGKSLKTNRWGPSSSSAGFVCGPSCLWGGAGVLCSAVLSRKASIQNLAVFSHHKVTLLTANADKRNEKGGNAAVFGPPRWSHW